MTIEDPVVTLRWTAESYISEPDDPNNFIYETIGDLLIVDDKDRRPLVGKFGIYYVDLDQAMDEEVSAFDVFDSYSHTVGYYSALFSANSYNFSDRLIKLLKYELFGSNVLIIDRLELLPKYRGMGLGLEIMRHIIKRFGAGTSIIAIKPFPLQFEVEPSGRNEQKWCTRMGLTTFTSNIILATKKLTDYYNRLGFLRLNRTPFMVRATEWPFLKVQRKYDNQVCE